MKELKNDNTTPHVDPGTCDCFCGLKAEINMDVLPDTGKFVQQAQPFQATVPSYLHREVLFEIS